MNTKNAKKKKENSILNSKNMTVFGIAAAVVIIFSIITAILFPSEKPDNFQEMSSGTSALTSEVSGLTDVYTENAVETMNEAIETTNETPAPEENKPSEPQTDFGLPVSGNVTKDYSGDELVYSKTLNDWRTHNGIDFYAEEGTDVLASADGTVDAILENGMFGRTVILLHSNGIRTLYSNLADGNEVVVGDIISKGTPLGKVGSSASAEALEDPHLHFEVSVNDEPQNPHDYLPGTSSNEE